MACSEPIELHPRVDHRLRFCDRRDELLLLARESQGEGPAAKPADGVAEGAEGGLSHEISRLRRLVWKLALDSALCLHWSLDHHTLKLSDWQVGLIGTVSAALGLRLQWGAYTEAIELHAREEEEENEKMAAEEEGETLNGVQTPALLSPLSA